MVFPKLLMFSTSDHQVGVVWLRNPWCNLWNEPESWYHPNKTKCDVPAISRTNAPLGTLSPAVRSVSVCHLKRKMMKGPARGKEEEDEETKWGQWHFEVLVCLAGSVSNDLFHVEKWFYSMSYTNSRFGYQRPHRKSLSVRSDTEQSDTPDALSS